MHPMTSDTNNNSHRDSPLVKPSGGFRRRMRLAYENWQRRRTILALKSVNPQWLKNAGISRHDIEGMVDEIFQREIPVPVNAETNSRNEGDRQATA